MADQQVDIPDTIRTTATGVANVLHGEFGINVYPNQDPDAELYFSYLTPQPSAAYKSAITTLVQQLKADNNWNYFDRLWIFATEVQQHATISLKNPSSTAVIEVGTPTWTINQGYTGNALNMYLRLGLAPSAATLFTQNSASYGNYCRTNTATATAEMGCRDAAGANSAVINNKWSDNISYCNINSGGSANVAVASSLGLFSVRRTTANAIFLNRNGVQIATNAATASTGRSSREMYALGFNNNGALSTPTAKQLSMCYMGSSAITDSTFYTAFQTFATTRGFNV